MVWQHGISDFFRPLFSLKYERVGRIWRVLLTSTHQVNNNGHPFSAPEIRQFKLNCSTQKSISSAQSVTSIQKTSVQHTHQLNTKQRHLKTPVISTHKPSKNSFCFELTFFVLNRRVCWTDAFCVGLTPFSVELMDFGGGVVLALNWCVELRGTHRDQSPVEVRR